MTTALIYPLTTCPGIIIGNKSTHTLKFEAVACRRLHSLLTSCLVTLYIHSDSTTIVLVVVIRSTIRLYLRYCTRSSVPIVVFAFHYFFSLAAAVAAFFTAIFTPAPTHREPKVQNSIDGQGQASQGRLEFLPMMAPAKGSGIRPVSASMACPAAMSPAASAALPVTTI